MNHGALRFSGPGRVHTALLFIKPQQVNGEQAAGQMEKSSVSGFLLERVTCSHKSGKVQCFLDAGYVSGEWTRHSVEEVKHDNNQNEIKGTSSKKKHGTARKSYQLSLRGRGEAEPVGLSAVHEGGVELRGAHAQERGQGDGNVKKLDKREVPGQSLGHPPSPAVEVVMVLVETETDKRSSVKD